MPKVKVMNVEKFAASARKVGANEVEKLDLLRQNKTVMRFCASAKGSWPLAFQAAPHVFIVLQGEITFDVAPARAGKPLTDKVEKHVLKTGDAIVIPANMAHGGSVEAGQLAVAAEMTFVSRQDMVTRRG